MDYSQFKVLIVDDEVDLGELCVDSFEMEGFQVDFCKSATDALGQIEQSNHYDIIISDENMPDVTGLELLKQLAQERKLVNTLFFLSTGDVSVSESDIKDFGGAGLLAKPYDLDETVKLIKCHLQKKTAV